MNYKKIIVPVFLIILFLIVVVVVRQNRNIQINLPSEIVNGENKNEQEISSQIISKSETKTDDEKNINSNQNVPFVVQAPLGNWSDPVFQDGCEEASVVMAMGWVSGEQKISSQDALKKINDIIEFENKNFGYNADTDLSDVQKIFKQLFSYEKTSVKEDISSEDIRNEIENGSIVLLPVFGQALGNPNFTKLGPIAHMLVVIGYDQENKQFITNDPGTKRGENFRYGEKTLLDAIWEYPSGKGPLEIPKKGSMKKGMLVVSK